MSNLKEIICKLELKIQKIAVNASRNMVVSKSLLLG